jgi:hypothetical protein
MVNIHHRHHHPQDNDTDHTFSVVGFYGFGALQANNFSVTRVVSEKTLARKSKRSTLRTKTLLQMSLLGVVTKDDENIMPELLYSLTYSQPAAPIENQIQLSAAILSESRNIFFGLVLTILRVVDPGKCEITYLGKHTHHNFFWSNSTMPLLPPTANRYRQHCHDRLQPAFSRFAPG